MIDIEKLKEEEKKKPIIEKDWISHGFRCIVLFWGGHRNGYIAIPKDTFVVRMKIHHDDLPIYVHGGITYEGDELGEGVKQIVKNDGKVHWFGFDCAHAGDALTWEKLSPSDHFWTAEEVAKECEDMAEQFSKLTLRKVIEFKLQNEPEWLRKYVRIKKTMESIVDAI